MYKIAIIWKSKHKSHNIGGQNISVFLCVRMERYQQRSQISSQCIPFSFCNQIVLEKLIFAVLLVQSLQHNFNATVFRFFHKLVHVVLRKILYRLQGIGYIMAKPKPVNGRDFDFYEPQRLRTEFADWHPVCCCRILSPYCWRIIVVYLICFERGKKQSTTFSRG